MTLGKISDGITRNTLVLATGCFDILHAGHVQLLERAAEYGELHVGLNSDRSVRVLKGEHRPINPFLARATVIAALACVTKVFQIDDVRVSGAIRLLAPTYWVKGGDYTLATLDGSEVDAARETGTEIILLPTIGDYSTTKILERLAK